MPHHAFWFGEDQARYVVTVPQASIGRVSESAHAARISMPYLGLTEGDALTLAGERRILVTKLRQCYESWLPTYMAGQPG
jgi:phosphoribosylformylglycinamidine synthase